MYMAIEFSRPPDATMESLWGTLDATGTSKLPKTRLVIENYDITKVDEPIYFLDRNLKKYVTLTPDLYKDITEGRVRM